MKDAQGRVLYVGKAQSLRNRVRQYWQASRSATTAAAAHRVGHRPGRRPGVHAHRHRQRGAAARGEPGQAPPAALQRPPQGRQELPVHQGHPGRRLPAHRADPQAARRRQPLLRPVRLGEQRGRGDEPHPAAVPVPDLHHRHPRRRARARPALPAVPHQALPGPLHRGHRQGGLPRGHRPGDAVPRGPPGAGRRGASGGTWRPPPTPREYERAAALRDKVARHRAHDGEPEDGRLRAPRAGRAGLRPVRQRGRRAAVRHPRRQDRQPGRVPAGEPGRRTGRGGAVRVREPVLRHGRARSRRASWCRAPCRRRRSWRRSCGSGAAAAWPSTCPSAARAGRSWPSPARNAAETLAREQARWLADQGRTLGALEELADALGPAGRPDAHRVLRHQHHPGHEHRGQHGRVRGGPAAQRRVPPLPDQDRRRARTTSPATGRSSGGASGGRSRARRGAPRSCAGGCPTWSSSTAARAR